MTSVPRPVTRYGSPGLECGCDAEAYDTTRRGTFAEISFVFLA